MEPAIIVTLVGIGLLFVIVLIIWFMAASAYKNMSSEIKFMMGSMFAFQQQITNTFENYSEFILSGKEKGKEQVKSSIDKWMSTFEQVIGPAEVSKLRNHLNEKLEAADLEATKLINSEIVNDLYYVGSDWKSAILNSMNNLDNYLYSSESHPEAKTTMKSYQLGTIFAGSLM